jgi:hypothetical protein
MNSVILKRFLFPILDFYSKLPNEYFSMFHSFERGLNCVANCFSAHSFCFTHCQPSLLFLVLSGDLVLPAGLSNGHVLRPVDELDTKTGNPNPRDNALYGMGSSLERLLLFGCFPVVNFRVQTCDHVRRFLLRQAFKVHRWQLAQLLTHFLNSPFLLV